MRRFYQLVALGLATFWLPVTLCCALEAAGGEAICVNDACHDAADDSAKDGCRLVEDGRYHPAVALIKVVPPAVDLSALAMGMMRLRTLENALEDRHAAVLAEAERPRDWVPVWQFERRAAAPAHAPDSLIA